MATKEKIKKEFDEFAQKVTRLESLKKRFDALNTNGFEKEARIIKSKLKDTKAIPQIEREINSLENKITNKYKNQVHRVRSVNVKALKETDENLKRKINELRNEVKKKKKVSVKRQLSKEEVEFVKDIPKLEREIGKLKGMLEEQHRRTRIKIDSGVGVLVDSRFEEFHNKYKEKVHSALKKEVHEKFNEELKRRLDAEKKKIVNRLVSENENRLKIQSNELSRRLNYHYSSKEIELKKRFSERVGKLEKVKQKVVRDVQSEYSEKIRELEKLYKRRKEKL